MKNHYEIFRDNLRREMNARKLSQSDIARICGASKQAVSTWMKATRAPRMDKIEILCQYFGVTKSALLEEPCIKSSGINGMVALIDGVAAGSPIFAEDNIVGYIPTDVRNADECFGLIVRGESMINASIPDGARIIVHMQNTAEDGQIVVCRVNRDDATLKRFKRLGDHVLLMPENPLFEPIIVPSADFESGAAEIVGVVRQVIIDI